MTGNNTYHSSAGFTPAAVGNYWWYASYGGDSNNNTANSTCPSVTETVVKSSPTVTAAAPGSGTAGTAIARRARSRAPWLSGTSPTGTITFYEDGPSASAPATCTGGGWNSVGTATVTGNATYTPMPASPRP